MKRLAAPLALGLSLGALSAAAFLACSADSSGAGGAGGFGSGGSTGSNSDAYKLDVAPDGEKPPGPVIYTEYCGEGRCVPGPEPCRPTTTSSTSSGQGGAGGDGTGGAGGAPVVGCQVQIQNGEPQSVCAPVGSSTVNDVCLTSADCLAGLGCVLLPEGQGNGQCRPYCCAELEDCPSNTFCALQPLKESSQDLVPVCVQVEPCAPLENGCASDETCSIVRADGTASCVPIGEGKFCDACPCAKDFVCNLSTGRCQKLCHTDGTGECPGAGGTCQGGGNLPLGIGVCILGDADCGF